MAETTTTTTTPPPTTTTTTPPPQTWVESLNPEMKNFVSEQGFKDPSDVVAGYQGMLKLRGVAADKLIRTPDSYIDAKEQEAAWNSVYDRLGRPKTPQEYGIENKDDAENTKFMADTFHKAGLTKNQADQIAKSFNERQSTTQKAQVDGLQAQAQQDVNDLKQRWGNKYQDNLALAKKGQESKGLSNKQLDQMSAAIGLKATLEILNDYGRQTLESTYIEGNKGNPNYTPDAKAKIDMLRTDRNFQDRLLSGDKAAQVQWTDLHKQWADGMNLA